MRADGVGDRFVLLLIERVIAAHHPLQLGELADHPAHQIGLGEDRRAFGKIGIGADPRRKLARELPHALHALILRSELLVEHDLLELWHAVGQHDLAVLIEEELGVGETRPDHAFVPGDDRLAAVLGLHIGNHNEPVGELLSLLQREAFLVRLHGGGEHFGRHRKEGLVERAHQHNGPFGKPRILGKQRLVLDQSELLLPGERASAVANETGALLAVEDHFGGAELLHVIGEAFHGEGLGRHEAVTQRLLAAPDAVDLEGHDLAVEQAEDGMERPHPAKPARTPAHGFRPGKIPNDIRHDPGHDLCRRPAPLLDQRHVEGALLVLAPLRLIDGGKTCGFEEPLDGGIGRIDARALLLFPHIGRPRRQSVDDGGQPARRGEGPDRLVFEPRPGKRLPQETREVLARARLHACGDLLREQFEEQLSHRRRPPRS